MLTLGDQLNAERERWERERLGKRPPSPATTDAGLPVDPLYTPADLPNLDYLRDLGFPGEFPFTRGVYPTMYRGNHWTMRQYAGFDSAEDSNAWYKQLLAQGQTGLSVAFDLPSHLGYDSDDPQAVDDVGQVGVAIDTLEDVERLFDDIPIDEVSVNFTINAPAAVILAMYVAVAQRRGVPLARLAGTLQNDILKEFLARNLYIFPPEPSLRLTADVIQYCSEHLPRFNPISVTGFHAREAGCDAIQEVAFLIGAALVYTDRVLARGIPIDQFAPRLSFHFATTLDFFEEIAKLRAARRLWARLVQERYDAQDPKSYMFRFFSGGSGPPLASREPLNNIVRVAFECLAAVLGGAQAIHTMAYDEAYRIPSAQSVRIALRTQQIVAYETGVARTVDPLGGSYYVESLTNAVEAAVRRTLEAIEASGGYVAALERGDLQRAILTRAYAHEQAVQSGEKVWVGVNRFTSDDGDQEPAELHESDPQAAERQIDRLKAFRATRDAAAQAAALERLRAAAAGSANLMPVLVEAVTAKATLGEICGVLRDVWGEYRGPNVL
jgi:methylmalonyl-CoA mutase N-terminal domain/subunit